MTAAHTGACHGDGVRRQGLAFGLLATLIWGGFLVVSRYGISAGLRATDLAFLRYLTSGVILLPWLLRHSPGRLAGVGWRRGMCLAVLAGPLFIVVSASGYRFAPLAHAAVIQLGMLTLVSIVLAAKMLGERPGAIRLAGLVVVVSGLAITAGPGLLHGSSTAWIGDMLFALAGSMWALFSLLQRRWGIAPLAATAVVSVLSAAVYTPVYLACTGLQIFSVAGPAVLVVQIIAQGVLSGVVALFAFSRAVQDLGPGRAALFPALSPGVAILLDIPVSGDLPSAVQLAGLGIMTTGLIIAVSARRA
ncbi:DMT family transporter [Paraburkholderia sp. RL17-337-BIB-A]|uniref:DMT family transporter n=1 Tax=Paraburkholderia sp. RL17-337-BIB-A TaxID=3031636 RepID=UPI0038B792A2